MLIDVLNDEVSDTTGDDNSSKAKYTNTHENIQ
jgi:hypothetical protein